MKTTKRLFMSGVTIALAAAFSLPAVAAEQGKLLIWINGDKGHKGLAKIGEEFSKATGVQVVVERPEDAANKFQQAAAAGKGPDIWIWAHDRIGEWRTAGLLSPVTPSKKTREAISDLGWKAFTVDGKTWGYPIAIESVALIYNKDLVPTPPKSFDEVIALDKKLSASGKKAILWDYTTPYFSWPLLAANGGYAFKAKADGSFDPKNTGVNNKGAIEGMSLLKKMIDTGVLPKSASYAEMEAGMNQGKVAMMINGPWSWDNLKKSKINFGIAQIPNVGSKAGAPFVGVLGAMINQSSPNKEIAVEFIENHMLTVKGLKMINDDVPLGVPTNKAFYDELKANPNIQFSMNSAMKGTPMPSNPEMGKFWSNMESAFKNVSQGRQAPKEALDAAAARIIAK